MERCRDQPLRVLQAALPSQEEAPPSQGSSLCRRLGKSPLLSSDCKTTKRTSLVQTYSSNFAGAAESPEKRAAFAKSCIQLVENYGLDGIDVDWEYPKTDQEAKNYVELLRATREALDEPATRKGEQENGYELTIAAVSV